jgi:sirohydrochlorin ferrochelatase
VPADAGPSRPTVIGLAHGSRHIRGQQAIDALLAAVASLGGVPARPAYLDLAPPDLTTVAAELAAAGQSTAVVVPLLFTEAYHARIDVPQTVAAAQAATGVDLRVTDVLGTGDDVLDLLLAELARAGVSATHSVLLYAVGSSDPRANAAVADLAARLAARRGRPAAVAYATCDPRPAAVVETLPDPVAVLPLFLADGLLLDPLRRLAAERGWPMTEPLGAAAADLVLTRYRRTVP